MNVDRARFLFLTGVISAGVVAACSSADTKTNGAGTTNTTTSDAGGDDMATTGAMDATTGDDDEQDAAPTDAAVVVDAGITPPADASTSCNDNTYTGANACAPYYPDAGTPDASSSSNGCIDQGGCSTFVYNLKPKLIASASNCIAALPTCESGSTALAQCITNAVVAACPDTAATAACTTVNAICADAGFDAGSVSQCATTLNGFTPLGRTRYIACMSEGGCEDPTAVQDCIDEVLSQGAP